MECNICGRGEFVDMNRRKAVRCKNCGSLERTRLLWLFIEKLKIGPDWKLLHLAPEVGIYNKLSRLVRPENYIAADFDPARYPFAKGLRKIDLTDMEDWPSNEFDLILHSHVMEHIPCNIAYPLYHLHRMLKTEGMHLCIIPFGHGTYDECFNDIGDAERTRRFGQFDHVRRFGRDGIPSHLGKLINLPSHFDATEIFDESILTKHNIPKNYWKGFHICTVLSLRKNDFLLR